MSARTGLVTGGEAEELVDELAQEFDGGGLGFGAAQDVGVGGGSQRGGEGGVKLCRAVFEHDHAAGWMPCHAGVAPPVFFSTYWMMFLTKALNCAAFWGT